MSVKKAAALPLSALQDRTKGPVHHIEIHPAKNGKGGRAFLTKVFRKPSKTAQANAAQTGAYLPDAALDGEYQHQDGNDMLDHMGRQLGIQPEDDGDADDDSGGPQ